MLTERVLDSQAAQAKLERLVGVVVKGCVNYLRVPEQAQAIADIVRKVYMETPVYQMREASHIAAAHIAMMVGKDDPNAVDHVATLISLNMHHFMIESERIVSELFGLADLDGTFTEGALLDRGFSHQAIREAVNLGLLRHNLTGGLVSIQEQHRNGKLKPVVERIFKKKEEEDPKEKKCPTCGQEFPDHFDLQLHRYEVHGLRSKSFDEARSKKIKCPHCPDTSFRSRFTALMHQFYKHDMSKQKSPFGDEIKKGVRFNKEKDPIMGDPKDTPVMEANLRKPQNYSPGTKVRDIYTGKTNTVKRAYWQNYAGGDTADYTVEFEEGGWNKSTNLDPVANESVAEAFQVGQKVVKEVGGVAVTFIIQDPSGTMVSEDGKLTDRATPDLPLAQMTNQEKQAAAQANAKLQKAPAAVPAKPAGGMSSTNSSGSAMGERRAIELGDSVEDQMAAAEGTLIEGPGASPRMKGMMARRMLNSMEKQVRDKVPYTRHPASRTRYGQIDVKQPDGSTIQLFPSGVGPASNGEYGFVAAAALVTADGKRQGLKYQDALQMIGASGADPTISGDDRGVAWEG